MPFLGMGCLFTLFFPLIVYNLTKAKLKREADNLMSEDSSQKTSS